MSTPNEKIQIIATEAAEESIEIKDALADLEIQTADDYEEAAELLVDVKARFKEIEAEKYKVVKPLKAAASTVEGWFREPLRSLKASETTLKGKMSAYLMDLRTARDDALKEAQKQAQKGKHKEAMALVQGSEDDRPEVGGVSTRSKWTYRVTDESKIPSEFWVVDHGAIAAHVRTNKDRTNLPGVEAFEEISIAASTKRKK